MTDPILNAAPAYVQKMWETPAIFIRMVCQSNVIQSYFRWVYELLVINKRCPAIEDLPQSDKVELWETAKDVIHNSGYECSKELGITMCKTLIVIQMLK